VREAAPLSAAYTADRAAALAGVPLSTLHYWTRTQLLVPSVSSEKVKRWSYADLLVLRLVAWLRSEKANSGRAPDAPTLPKTSVRRVRAMLERTTNLREHLLSLPVYVDGAGRLILEGPLGFLYLPLGRGFDQGLIDHGVDLIQPFETQAGISGPDLARPRETLRIIPGKLAGEPHVEGTRIPTNMIRALDRRGFETDRIIELYPSLQPGNVVEAIDLERQLERNLGRRAA